MIPELIPFKPLAQAIERLLHPYAEIVLHDLKKQRIAAIYNPFSRRSAGDDCLIDAEMDLSVLPDFFSPYDKTNWDGRKLKSTSMTIRNSLGEPVGLFCINLDISVLEECKRFIEQFTRLKPPTVVPQDFFYDDWREKVNSAISLFLMDQQLTLEKLSAKQRRELYDLLQEKGLMKDKQVIDYIQMTLKMVKPQTKSSAKAALNEFA